MSGKMCPSCDGRGFDAGMACGRSGGCRPVTVKCDVCAGYGVVSAERMEWIERGAAMRQERRSRKMTLREEAQRRGMSILDLSRMERGIEEPKEQPHD